MVGHYVIATYRPRPGQEAALVAWATFATLAELPGADKPFPHFELVAP